MAQNNHRQAILEHLTAMESEARAARGRQEHAETVRLYRTLLDIERLPGLQGLYAQAHYEIARALAHLDQPTDALNALRDAVQEGFTNAAHTEKDGDLQALRSHPDFAQALEGMKANQTRLKVYAVTAWDNPDLSHAPPHTFDRMDGPKPEQLRTAHDLRALTEGAPDQLTAQTKVLDWVHRRWAHSGLMEPSAPDALTILAEVAAGARFRCVEYSIVLAQTLHALGCPARIVRLRSQGMSYGIGKGHVTTEAWNDDLQKWIILDGQNNTFWTDGHVPLNAAELQTRLTKDTTHDVRMVHQGSNWLEEAPDQATWLRYFAYASITRDNRIFEHDHAAPTDKFILLHPKQHPELLFQGMPLAEDFTTHRPLLYPTLNRVHVRLETPSNTPQTPDNQLKAHMSHTAPSFDHYEVNGAIFEPESGEPWIWTLQPGANSLVVRTVNAAGIKGAPTRIELVYHPRK